MNVSVGARWEAYIEELLKAGRYGSASEVDADRVLVPGGVRGEVGGIEGASERAQPRDQPRGDGARVEVVGASRREPPERLGERRLAEDVADLRLATLAIEEDTRGAAIRAEVFL